MKNDNVLFFPTARIVDKSERDTLMEVVRRLIPYRENQDVDLALEVLEARIQQLIDEAAGVGQ